MAMMWPVYGSKNTYQKPLGIFLITLYAQEYINKNNKNVSQSYRKLRQF